MGAVQKNQTTSNSRCALVLLLGECERDVWSHLSVKVIQSAVPAVAGLVARGVALDCYAEQLDWSWYRVSMEKQLSPILGC
jgi:hypothetical protein